MNTLLGTHLSAMQGRFEQQRETYFRYVDRAAESLTPQCVKNAEKMAVLPAIWRRSAEAANG